MIHPTTRFRIARVPLAQIVISTVEPRYLARASEYVQRLTDEPTDDVLIALGVVGVLPDGLPLYYVQDGRHRFIASLLTGRPDVLALIHYEAGDPGYDEASAPLATPAPTPTPVSAPVTPDASAS